MDENIAYINQYNGQQAQYQAVGATNIANCYSPYPYYPYYQPYYIYPLPDPRIDDLKKEIAELKEMVKCLKHSLDSRLSY